MRPDRICEGVLVEALEKALEELPAESANCLLRVRCWGGVSRSCEESGVSVSTLLSRKRYQCCVCANGCRESTQSL